jgi:hypothetical protein
MALTTDLLPEKRRRLYFGKVLPRKRSLVSGGKLTQAAIFLGQTQDRLGGVLAAEITQLMICIKY